jgi:hypothetical protein
MALARQGGSMHLFDAGTASSAGMPSSVPPAAHGVAFAMKC